MAKSIPKDFIDSLIDKANIVDIIGNYIKLEKKGNDYWARCPFHSEKTSSFSVSENKQFFHCFGCGAHGNAIGFVMDHTNKTYPEAIESIANTLGIEIPRDKETSKIYEARKILKDSLNDAKKIFENQLKNSENAISYLKERKISGETAKKFQIGYAEDDFQVINKSLSDAYTESNLLDAGLIVKKDKNSYDKFRDRIMFPIHDQSGNIIAFGGRILKEDKEKPMAKYMNSPETSLFSKKRVLYNLHLAKQDKDSKEFLYIVEGYMDVIKLYQAGIKNSVATLGTAVTQENLIQCFKYTREIICCFDGDKAGEKAAWQGVENIMPVIKDGDAISFVFLPENHDPDNIIEKGGIKLWNECVNKKISIEEFIYIKFSKETDLNTAAGKTQYLQKADALLNKLNAKILKDIIYEFLKEKVGVKYIAENHKQKTIVNNKQYKTTSPLQKAILILLHNPNIKINEDLINDFRIKDNQGIVLLKSILDLIKRNKNMKLGGILENFRDDKQAYLSLEKISRMPITDYDYPDKELNACLCLTIKNFLKSKLKDIDPSNLKEFSTAQQEIREIEEEAKNY
ncbi:MAG: DNA primase [Gammaproteobacteria bacterium]|nr:DNA primase [Gammaproteobacteria bacterium]|tara:strand:- start:1357 stop:3069 length:1713 start_codon:yes stop_codon:yes gene_type:complete